MNKIHIVGGGTFSHVRNHLALAAPAFGTTARKLYGMFEKAAVAEFEDATPVYDRHDLTFRRNRALEYSAGRVALHLTKMADHTSRLVTNADVEKLLDKLIADPDTRVIVLNAALCDYNGDVVQWDYTNGSLGEPYVAAPRGSHAERLKTRNGPVELRLTPAAKLISKIRKERKDIFVVGFKTTTNATPDEQYVTALKMLKENSLNLVLANDTVTRFNMIVVPEEARYSETTDRAKVLAVLVQMTLARSQNTFTRSTVVPGDSVAWDDPLIPDNLRQVVNHCIERGAYKQFLGSTAGHFAVKIDEKTILTSKRKHDHNELAKIGLVRVEYDGDDEVIAYGTKPSVGGQSQRAVFRDHPGLDCIVHFHCPEKDHVGISVAPQWQNECGSHQCGQNTSDGLRSVPGFDDKLKAVMLHNHGPNIVFSRDVDPAKIIEFIDAKFDLAAKTGGLVEIAA